MKIKKYFASNMRQALEMAKQEQGPDVMILSNRKVLGGVELIAAEDYDEAAFNRLNAETRQKAEQRQLNRPEPATATSSVTATAATLPARGKQETMSDIWTNESTIDQMRDEIKSLRTMLEHQMSGLAWGDIGRQHPLWANVIRHLINMDLSPALARRLVREIPEHYQFEQARRTALALLSYQVPLYNDKIMARGQVVQFLGSSGSGKTTTIAKLATRFALEHSPRDILLATTDVYRVGGREQLRGYARILGIPLRSISNRDEYLSLFEESSSDKLVLVDTAGLSQRDDKFEQQMNMLRLGISETSNCLILPATENYNSLTRLIESYRNVSLNCCIPTKLDEATSLGGLLSTAIDKALPIAAVCDGQRVPEDLQKPKAHELVSRVVSRAKQSQLSVDEEHLEQAFGQNEFTHGMRH